MSHISIDSPASVSRAGGTSPIYLGKETLTSMSHVKDFPTTPASHVRDEILVAASHGRGISLVIASHAGGMSLVTASHNSNGSPTSVGHISIDSPASVSRVGGTSPNSLGKESLISVSHVKDFPPTTASYVGRMDVDEKLNSRSFKPKFPCKKCKGDHITHLCPSILKVQRMWSESEGSSNPEFFVVSQYLINHWLIKWSSQCNLWLITLLFWGVKCLTT